MIKSVTVDAKRIRGKLWFQINWQTGASSVHEIHRLNIRYRDSSGGEIIEQRIRQLHAERQTDKQIATTLNTEGYRTTRGGAFKPHNIYYLRKRWALANVKIDGMSADGLRWEDGSYTIRGVMDTVGVSRATVHRWLKQGRLQGTHLGPYMLWRFKLTDKKIRALCTHAKQTQRTQSIR